LVKERSIAGIEQLGFSDQGIFMHHYRGSLSTFLISCICLVSVPFPSSSQEAKRVDPLRELLDYPAPPPGKDVRRPYWDAGPESDDDPPTDAAPIDILIDFWSSTSNVDPPIKPSDTVRQRLLEACENEPELLFSLWNRLIDAPEAPDRIKNLLDRIAGNPQPSEQQWEKESKKVIKEWLMLNTTYFRDELIASASQASDGNGFVENELELRALAKLDWATAQPLIEGYSSGADIRTAVLALSLLYEHAISEKDEAMALAFREKLKLVVKDARFPAYARHTACETLLTNEWDGLDDWYISLFIDPSLDELIDERFQSAPLNRLIQKDPDKWVPIINKLVGHSDRSIHNAAVSRLISLMPDQAPPESIKPLLPWLTDSEWTDKGEKEELILSLSKVKVPESVPGLIWIVENDEENRTNAVNSLAFQRDARAIPAIRRALEKAQASEKPDYLRALNSCGGLNVDEMVASIEAYAKRLMTVPGDDVLERFFDINSRYEELSDTENIGMILGQPEEPNEELAARLLERIKVLESRQPKLVASIQNIIQEWPLRITALDLLRRLAEGWADAEAIYSALRRREILRDIAGDELRELMKNSGQAKGVATVLLKDQQSAHELLEGKDREAQRALLACARLVRGQLPVELAAQLLKRGDPALTLAVERYLESEDSSEARKILLARRPREAVILGAWAKFYPKENPFRLFQLQEDKLRAEVKNSNGPDEIFAMLDGRLVNSTYSTSPGNSIIVRIRGGRASMVWQRDPAREQYRELADNEREELKSFVSEHSVDDLGPTLEWGHHISSAYEYLHLTRDGGRRVFIVTPGKPDYGRKIHNRLSKLFFNLTKTGDFKLRYKMTDEIENVEVLYADEENKVEAVCRQAAELRVLISKQVDGASVREWHDFSQGIPGRIVEQPAECPILNGLWRYGRGHVPITLAEDDYKNPIVTPDGKWVVTEKFIEREKHNLTICVRISVATGREYKILLPEIDGFEPIGFVPEHGKIVIAVTRKTSEVKEYRLLDPATGLSEKIKGEFKPLTQQTYRSLQPTGRPNEFWAAIVSEKDWSTEVGRYDAKRFVFTPVSRFPKISFDSMQMLVDEAEGKIYVAYNGHLLRLPLFHTIPDLRPSDTDAGQEQHERRKND
jgi:hypothetical protein